MIKFFRNIRKQLAAKNKFAQYSRYAIGEILLVVIGILIALQINNNNEASKNEEQFLKILSELRSDLQEDIRNAQGILSRGKEMDSLTTLVLEERLTREDYRNPDKINLLWVGLQFNPFEYRKTAFAKYENFQGVIPEEYDDLVEGINHYYNTIGGIYDDLYANLRAQISERHSYLARHTDWYYKLRKREYSEEMISFYLENPIYKNWVSQHRADNTAGERGVMSWVNIGALTLVLSLNEVLEDQVVFEHEEIRSLLGHELGEEDRKLQGVYVEGGVEFTIKNVGGYLLKDQKFLLSKRGSNHFVNVFRERYNNHRIVPKRDSSNKVIGLTTYVRDTIIDSYAKKISSD